MLLRPVLEAILRLHGAPALLVIFALPFLEASLFVGFIFPGEIAVLLGGVLANQHRVGLTAVLVAAIAGAILGDSVGYAVGHRFGDRLLRRVPDRLLDDAKVDKAKDLVRRLGGKAVFVGRFTAAARVLVPGLAGTAGIHYGRFLFFNVTGGALWATGFVLLGYAAGSQYQAVERNASLVSYGILALLVVLGAVLVLRRRRRRRGHDRDAAPPTTTPTTPTPAPTP